MSCSQLAVDRRTLRYGANTQTTKLIGTPCSCCFFRESIDTSMPQPPVCGRSLCVAPSMRSVGAHPGISEHKSQVRSDVAQNFRPVTAYRATHRLPRAHRCTNFGHMFWNQRERVVKCPIAQGSSKWCNVRTCCGCCCAVSAMVCSFLATVLCPWASGPSVIL
jgi:hypothetical protein